MFETAMTIILFALLYLFAGFFIGSMFENSRQKYHINYDENQLWAVVFFYPIIILFLIIKLLWGAIEGLVEIFAEIFELSVEEEEE